MIQLIYLLGRWNLPLRINLPQVKNHWSRTRALVTAAQWSLVVNDFLIKLFLKYSIWALVSEFIADLRLVVSNYITRMQRLLVEATEDVSYSAVQKFKTTCVNYVFVQFHSCFS